MAYNYHNHREWDQGKDSWDKGPSGWHSNERRGNTRHRDDDYTAEPKRRKYNDGGYQGHPRNQGYDNHQGYDNQGYDQGYGDQGGCDDPGYGGGSHGHGYGGHQQDHRDNNYEGNDYDNSYDYGYDERPHHKGGDRGPGGGYNKKRMMPSEPSPHVIFLGLDPDFTEADLQAYLTAQGCTLESITIIRDRTSGVSKGFGFAQFASTEDAQAFVQPLFPFIQMPPPASHGASARNAFYKALEMNQQHNGRRVKIDYSQSASPTDRGRAKANANDGTRDIGNTQSAILLFRGLDPLSGPQAIHQAMLTSNGPGKQGAKGMKRIILIKDKITMASFGFAFVEFVDVESASAVLAATMSPQLHPNGFRISDKPVAASFAHPYSFQPVTDFLQRDEACLAGSSTLGGVDGWVRYWDESSTVAVLDFKVEEPAKPAQPDKKKEKKKVKETKVAAAVGPSVLPLSDKPVMLSLSKAPMKIGLGPSTVKTLPSGLSLDDAPEEAEEPPTEPNKPMPVKRVAPLIASKKIANNINKWNQVQEVLHTDPAATPAQAQKPTPAPAPIAAAAPAVPVAATKPAMVKSAEASPAPEDEFEFSDTSALMCLLCSRQFKTIDVLKRHNKESDLHKKNYKDQNLREIARQKAAARKAAPASSSTTPQPKPEEGPKYRDRASERRVLFNQPDIPLPEPSSGSGASGGGAGGGGGGGRKRSAEGPPRPPTPPPPALAPAKDESNMGNKLLKMMGWQEGMGLGTDGEGRVDPIQTAVYAQGAGLGASKGKDIAKYTEGMSGFSGYMNMVQESARERYGS